ncbi:TIGR03618 family F420-dependent PPOX class oxidoreductase [Actinoplanes sp. CA-131856]
MTGPLITAEELAVRDDSPLILDATVDLPAAEFDGDHRARSGWSGWQKAHIPGSHHADLLTTFSDARAPYHFARPTPEALADALSDLGLTDNTSVVVYDRAGGIWAARLWYLLDWIGIPTQVLDGGLPAWQAAGFPIASTTATAHIEPAPATAQSAPATTARAGGLTPRPKDGRWITRADLETWLAGDTEASVQCALNPEAFRGEVPTRYSRRGHLPGSGNLPARLLNAPDGRLLPPAQLKPVLSELLNDPRPLWLYCGGGISAAGLALALAVAGRNDVALYDGSLEEWSADPSLPLTVGPEPTERPGNTARPSDTPRPSYSITPSGAVRLSGAVRELIDRPEFAVLATAEPDGSSQLSVMWVGRDGDNLVMATKDGRRKVRNIRRDSRVTVLVYDRQRPTRYVEIRGRATVVGEGGAALVNELARRYTGRDHVIGDPAEEADRVVLRIVPDRVVDQL